MVEDDDKVIGGFEKCQFGVIKVWVITRTKSHHRYVYQFENNYQNQGYRSRRHIGRKNDIKGGYQIGDLYPCQKVVFGSIYFMVCFYED